MTTMPMKPTTTVRLSYLYREGDNHTRVGDVLLANPEGVELKEATRRLCAALEDEQYFIARQVRVPGLFHAAAGQPATDADHAWHTFADMGLCDEEPNDMHGRTLTQFLAEIEAAARAGWQANVLVGAPWEGEYVQVAGNAGVVLKVLSNWSRKASISWNGAEGPGSSPSCQCQGAICLSTEGSRVMIEIGTWLLGAGPLTVLCGCSSPSRMRTRFGSFSSVTHEVRAVIAYWID